ncbi:WYL domain-containing protein [Microbacterium sp. H1-D42]|uniref:helix-turn-helix transcriptional regulator n=1 Tax=Microbacterium sp. H1-D42 TaxID=2925844 RepID=UPI001F536AC5|nr:WYL domain-containing protein [Microbacterium sp. H1-D42]UNK72312.1 WYL domain-containing protein [Microbacterium sp. H1-D42]
MLEDDEAIATVLSLKLAASGATVGEETMTSSERAEAKIQRILPPRLRRTVDAIISTTDISSTAGALPETGTAKTVAEAITTRRVLSFDYAKTSHATQRGVEPARLVRLQQRWYLFSWDRDRSDWRAFRLDRMSNVLMGVERFQPRPLPADDLPAYLHTRFQGVPERTIVLTLYDTAEHAADRLYRIDGTIEPISERKCRYTAHVDSYEWLALSLTLTDIEFTIESPDDFRDYLAHHASRMLRGTR